MQDRVPLYPGRVKLVPVAGLTNTYTMTRDDHPTQEGTPLNKATFLSDATAALYGLGDDAVPDKILEMIKLLLDTAQSTADVKAQIETGSYTGNKTESVTLTFSKPPRLVFVTGGRERYSASLGQGWYAGLFCYSSPYGFTFGPSTNLTSSIMIDISGVFVELEWSGNSLTWSTSGLSDATGLVNLNQSKTEYYYIALF